MLSLISSYRPLGLTNAIVSERNLQAIGLCSVFSLEPAKREGTGRKTGESYEIELSTCRVV